MVTRAQWLRRFRRSPTTVSTLPALDVSNLAYNEDALAGEALANIVGAPVGSTVELTPADGRLVLNGAGTQILRGLSAWSEGDITFTLTLRKPGARPRHFIFVADIGPAMSVLSSIWPGDGFNGTPDSGRAAAGLTIPVNPARPEAGQPWLRGLYEVQDPFSSDRIIGWHSGSVGGLSAVRVELEGRVVSIPLETVQTYTDVNGTTAGKFTGGHHIRLKAANWPVHTGVAHMYVIGVPTDPAQAERVLGPFPLRCRAPGSEWDFQADITPSLATSAPTRFATLKAAIDYGHALTHRAMKFTYTENCTPDISAAVATQFDTSETWVVATHAPGVTVNLRGGATNPTIRMKRDGMCFRGAGIVIDPMLATFFGETGSTGALWFDGVTVTQAGGRDAPFANTKTNPQSYWCSGKTDRLIFTDCVGSALYNGFCAALLVRGCSLTGVAADAYQNNRCTHNITLRGLSPLGWRGHSGNGAITLRHAPGTAFLEVSGTPNSSASTRVFAAKIGGVQVGATFSANKTVGSGSFEFNDVKTWWESLGPDFTATVDNNTRRAFLISHTTLLSPTTAFPAGGIAVSALGTQFSAIADVHADGGQYTGFLINYVARYVTYEDVEAAQGHFGDHSGTTFTDCCFENFLILFLDSSRSSVSGVHKNTRYANFTSNGAFHMVRGNTISSENFQPDSRTVVENFLCEAVAYDGAGPGGNAVADRIYVRTGTTPAGATNSLALASLPWSSILVNPVAHGDWSPIPAGPAIVGGRAVGRYDVGGVEQPL